MVTSTTTTTVIHQPGFNIYFVLTFIIGCFALFNPQSLSTAGAFMGWSLLFGFVKEHIHNHPGDKVDRFVHIW